MYVNMHRLPKYNFIKRWLCIKLRDGRAYTKPTASKEWCYAFDEVYYGLRACISLNEPVLVYLPH